METTVRIITNAYVAVLYEADQGMKTTVQQILSYHVKGYQEMPLYKMGRWDGTSSFFKWGNSAFPAGFVPYVTGMLRHLGYNVQIQRDPLPAPLGVKRAKIGTYPEDPRYDYQYEAVEKLERYGQIIACLSVGAGKTRVAQLAFARIRRPTLFLTTRALLMYQMKTNFERDLGMPVSVIGDGQFGMDTGEEKLGLFTVAMVQTLQSRLAGPQPKDDPATKRRKIELKHQTERMLDQFELLILEEAHEASGFGYFDICQRCHNAWYRLALTATPFMKDDEEANMRLMASSGPIGIKVTEKQLIDCGVLARPYFKFVKLTTKPKYLNKRTQWQSAYRIGIVENEERNQLIVKEALEAAKHKLPVMCLVAHKSHGATLEKMMNSAGLHAAFIFGDNNAEERKQRLAELKRGEIDVLIGSTILDVGVDVPAVGMVILAGAGKAEVSIRQRIGRGLRAKKDSPNVCFIVDFDDPFNQYLFNHANQRRAIIETTPGFNEGVVSEFPYELFG